MHVPPETPKKTPLLARLGKLIFSIPQPVVSPTGQTQLRKSLPRKMGLDSVRVRGPRMRGKGMKCALLGLFLVSGLFLAGFVVVFRGLWEGLLLDQGVPAALDRLGGALALDEENRGTLMATKVKTDGKPAKSTGLAMTTSVAAATWEKEDPEIDVIEVVPLKSESTSSVPEKPIVDPTKATEDNTTELISSTWVPVYNDPLDISRTIFYGIPRHF